MNDDTVIIVEFTNKLSVSMSENERTKDNKSFMNISSFQ